MSDICISVTTRTWDRESNGLFDYESSNILKNKFKINSSSYLIQNNTNLETHPNSSEYTPTPETKYLLYFNKSENQFTLECNSQELFPPRARLEKSWLVLNKKHGVQKYTLSEGDVIRLGKARLKVKEIKGPKKTLISKTAANSRYISQGGLSGTPKKPEQIEPILVQTPNEDDLEASCRICLEENTKTNPLIKPCSCAGSMAAIHIECLQKWFMTKVATRELANQTSYSWSTLKCELCHYKYPEKFSVKNEVFELLALKKPENNYISLESENETSQETQNIKIVSFNGKKILKLGRGNDSDIVFKDISVSRNHANIQITESGLELEDINSKFGTLIKINKKISLTIGAKFSVQCGRSFITISIKKPFRLFSCFGCAKGAAANEKRNLKEVARKSQV